MLKNLKISGKLMVAFGTVLVFLCVTVIAALIGLNVVMQDYKSFYERDYRVVETTINMQRNFQNAEKLLIRSFTTEKVQDKQLYIQNSQNALSEMEEQIVLLEQLSNRQDLVELFREQFEALMQTSNRIFLMSISTGNAEAIQVFDNNFAQPIEDARGVLQEVAEAAKLQADDAYSRSEGMKSLVMLMLIVIAAVSVGVLLFFWFYITGSLTRPISEIEAAAEQMASGNLGISIGYRSKDELGKLSGSMNHMTATLKGYVQSIDEVLGELARGNFTVETDTDFVGDFAPIKDSMTGIAESLSRTLLEIDQAAEQVASGSEQVSGGAQALSQGATEQASSIEELSATVDEISGNVRMNAENAQLSNRKVMETAEEIESGNAQMNELIAAMNEIKATTDQIGKIIKAIDDIAFQTNILALNAAVEAARAGAAGKGFAVVADEVRNLAAKSADAAKNTTQLIESSVKAVGNGASIAAETAEKLQSMKQKAEESSRLVDEITRASGDQANAVVQIMQGLEQIAVVVQTNSATAEESAAASEELNSQAQVLKSLVGQFRIDRSEGEVFLQPQDNEDAESFSDIEYVAYMDEPKTEQEYADDTSDY